MIRGQEKSRITRQVKEIKDIIEEYGTHPDDYDSLKTAVEIWDICMRPVRDSQRDMADYGALDAAADMGEE